jgi:oxalate decarboxylase/phosphoglucose isomerase-like protein (cupin superfamily)
VLGVNELVSNGVSRTVVNKLWGVEDWIVNTPLYCGKVLVMHEGWQSSLHYHPIKDETMLCIDGCCVVEVYPQGIEGSKEFIAMRAEDRSALRLPPNTPHRFMTSMGNTCTLVEFSTTHSDEDVVRFENSKELYGGH